MSQIGREEVSGVPGIEHEIHRFVEHKPRLNKKKFRLKSKLNSSHHRNNLCQKCRGIFVLWVLPKLYVPSTLNIDLILWHTIECVCIKC